MILKKEKEYYISNNSKLSNDYFHELSRETTLKCTTITEKGGIKKSVPLIRVKGVIYCSLSYKDIVIELIREKYCINDEIAILRQRDNKSEEYQEYYDYVEQCKSVAKDFITERQKVLGK